MSNSKNGLKSGHVLEIMNYIEDEYIESALKRLDYMGNKYARKKKFLPFKFNEQKKLKDDTIIRHFSMTIKFFPKFRTQNIKPWNIDKVHSVLGITEFDDILDEYIRIISEETKQPF